MEYLYQTLGITHVWTSAYYPQMDAKCEYVHFSVHNMVTKLVGDKHERWSDLLGTVSLTYNATIHSGTGYSPHKLFYSFCSRLSSGRHGDSTIARAIWKC